MLYKTSVDAYDIPANYQLRGGQGPQDKPEDYFTFGSSGFLYRSNKLMYDRQTDTLWHQLWGTPAFGSLVGSGIQLERLPVTLTTWQAWLEQHPDTRVMSFDTGFSRDYRAGAAYADYFASPNTMFPVWRRSELLPTKSWVFTQLINDQPKAYPLSTLKDEQVVNDTLAGQELVIIYDTGGLGARAYARAGHTFEPVSPQTSSEVVDETGTIWQVTEEALQGEAGDRLARLPGHMAFWFGWFSFYPHTELYGE